MSLPDWAATDPRVVHANFHGRDFRFWLHHRGNDMAAAQGFDAEAYFDGDQGSSMERVLRFLWVAALAFDPELPYDDFDLFFLPSDYPRLSHLVEEIVDKQGAPPEEDADAGKELADETPTPSS